ncbi:MAG TPA: ABC transporter ATP-binding protein [Cellulomonas sp.]
MTDAIPVPGPVRAPRREVPGVGGAGASDAAGGGLRVRGLVVRYPGAGRGAAPVTAVDGVDLDVPTGQVLALLGPSGCGKSSLLRAVAGLEPAADGVVRWDETDLRAVPVHRRGFGLVFQDGQLFPHRDVAGNVGYGLGRPGDRSGTTDRRSRTVRVAALLDLVGLPGYQHRPVATLSGGERQRVALARSLAPRPRLLLLDEPLSALDRSLRERLADDLREVLVATGTTALFVTHDQDEAFTVADRVAVMSAGRLLQVAPPEELWRRPAGREVAEFLGYRTFLRGPGAGPTAPLVGVAPGGWRVLGDAEAGSSLTRTATVTARRTRRGRLEVVADLDLVPEHDPLPGDASEGVTAVPTRAEPVERSESSGPPDGRGSSRSAAARPWTTVQVTAALPAGAIPPEPGDRVHLVADEGAVAVLTPAT